MIVGFVVLAVVRKGGTGWEAPGMILAACRTMVVLGRHDG